MIKIYQPILHPYNTTNSFVHAMMDGFEELYDDIKWKWGHEMFWKERIFNYDILLVQWPDKIYKWEGNPNNEHTLEDYKNRIVEIKAKGVKIVSFVHDFETHYCKDTLLRKFYDLIYSSADVLLHMGEYSKQFLTEKYPHVRHENIGPHFIYDQVYKKTYTKEEGCSVLGFDKKYKYVLAFGAFRDDEERELIINLAEDLRNFDKRIMILAPCFSDIATSKNRFDIRPRLQKYLLKHKKHIICNGKSFYSVPDDLLPYYYAVADVCILHRKKILNSGNVPMAFLMNKIIAGPNVGNVGELLREMGNPVFDINNRKSICEAVIRSLELAKEGKGQWNHDYAMGHFSTEVFCERLHRVLLETIRYAKL